MQADCRRTSSDLSAWLDGELNDADGCRCVEHVAQCASCRAEHDRLAMARSLLRAMPAPPVPVGLAATIKAAASEEMSREGVVWLWPRWAAPLAAAAALVLGLGIAHMMGTDTATSGLEVATSPPAAVITAPPAVGPVAITSADVGVVEEAVFSSSDVRPARAAPAATAGERIATAETTPAPDTTPGPGAAVLFSFAPDREQDALSTNVPASPRVSPPDAALAIAPRLTRVEGSISSPPGPKPPTALDRELAGGVVARMLIEDFVGEHMIDTGPTMLSVVTATPSAELGPTLVEGEDDARFELNFTEAMRRALAATQE